MIIIFYIFILYCQLQNIEEQRDVVITRKDLVRITLREPKEKIDPSDQVSFES